MTTFNKNLMKSIVLHNVSKEKYYEILKLFAIIKDNEAKENELKKEKSNLLKDLLLVNSVQDKKLHNSVKAEILHNINLICNKTEVELFKSTLEVKQKIFEIIPNMEPQYSKSSPTKYQKQLENLLIQKEKLEKEINYCKREIQFLKGNAIQNQIFENYINTLVQKKLPKIKKEILKQKFYINYFSKNNGR